MCQYFRNVCSSVYFMREFGYPSLANKDPMTVIESYDCRVLILGVEQLRLPAPSLSSLHEKERRSSESESQGPSCALLLLLPAPSRADLLLQRV